MMKKITTRGIVITRLIPELAALIIEPNTFALKHCGQIYIVTNYCKDHIDSSGVITVLRNVHVTTEHCM